MFVHVPKHVPELHQACQQQSGTSRLSRAPSCQPGCACCMLVRASQAPALGGAPVGMSGSTPTVPVGHGRALGGTLSCCLWSLVIGFSLLACPAGWRGWLRRSRMPYFQIFRRGRPRHVILRVRTRPWRSKTAEIASK